MQQRDDRTRLSLQAAESRLREFGAWSYIPKPPACLLLHCVGGYVAHHVGEFATILWVYVYAQFQVDAAATVVAVVDGVCHNKSRGVLQVEWPTLIKG